MVATTPEILALGGMTPSDIERLRVAMIGSVLTKSESARALQESPTARHTIDQIATHPTKAAGAYYLRYFSKYFLDMASAVGQASNALASGGRAVMVVQNSFFKDLEIDLSKVMQELMEFNGVRLEHMHSHPVVAPIAGSNPLYKKYRERNVRTENVLVFLK